MVSTEYETLKIRRREWWIDELDHAAMPVNISRWSPNGYPHGATVFVSADYCESLEREVKALREICEHYCITLGADSPPNRIRDERESGEL